MFWTVIFAVVLFLAPAGLPVSPDLPESPAGTSKKGETTTLVVTEKDGKVVVETRDRCVVADAEPGKRVCRVVTVDTREDPPTGDGKTVRVEKRVVVRCGEDGEKVVVEGGESAGARKLVLRLDGKNLLKDLGEGETRTLGEKGATVKVTRRGDKLFLTVDGADDLPEIPLDLDKEGKDGERKHCVVVRRSKGGENHEPIVLVDGEAAGERDIRLRLKVKTGQETLRFRVNDEDFEVGVGDLVEGQPKVLTHGSCTLTLTREGDEISVKVEKSPIVP